MIDLEKNHIDVVKNILKSLVPSLEIWAFGSRVTGKALKYSDLDLVLVGSEKIKWEEIERLKDAMSESDLPFVVDVVDYHAISERFKEIIKAQHVVMQKNVISTS